MNINVLVSAALCIALKVYHSTIIRLECLSFGNFDVKYEDKYYRGNTAKIVDGVTMDECALNCVSETICTAFNFIKNGGKCVLISEQINGTINEENLDDQPGSIFDSTDYDSALVSVNWFYLTRFHSVLKNLCSSEFTQQVP